MQAGYLHNLSKQNNNNKNCTIFQHKKKRTISSHNIREECGHAWNADQFCEIC